MTIKKHWSAVLSCHYQGVWRFPHSDEWDSDGERQGQIVRDRFDASVDGKPTGRQVHLYTSVTRRHLDRLHLVFSHLKRAHLPRVDEVDAVPHSTATDLA